MKKPLLYEVVFSMKRVFGAWRRFANEAGFAYEVCLRHDRTRASLHKFAKRIYFIFAVRQILHASNSEHFIVSNHCFKGDYVKRVTSIMRNDKLSAQSMAFAVSIINLVKALKAKRKSVISNQIGRSGTSIGANIREAQYAHGKADFIAKLQIALKEAKET